MMKKILLKPEKEMENYGKFTLPDVYVLFKRIFLYFTFKSKLRHIHGVSLIVFKIWNFFRLVKLKKCSNYNILPLNSKL